MTWHFISCGPQNNRTCWRSDRVNGACKTVLTNSSCFDCSASAFFAGGVTNRFQLYFGNRLICMCQYWRPASHLHTVHSGQREATSLKLDNERQSEQNKTSHLTVEALWYQSCPVCVILNEIQWEESSLLWLLFSINLNFLNEAYSRLQMSNGSKDKLSGRFNWGSGDQKLPITACFAHRWCIFF